MAEPGRHPGALVEWQPAPQVHVERVEKRIEGCACGGIIVAYGQNTASAVRAHQATPRHRTWWAEVGLR